MDKTLPHFFELDGVRCERIKLTRRRSELDRAMRIAGLLSMVNGPENSLEHLTLMFMRYCTDDVDITQFLDLNPDTFLEGAGDDIPEKHEHKIYDFYNFAQVALGTSFQLKPEARKILSSIAVGYDIAPEVVKDLIDKAKRMELAHIAVAEYHKE